MAIIYCSNQPGGTNGYGVGSDASGDPSNKATPYLTANVALDAMGDGDEVIFNDGTYTYDNNNGVRQFAVAASTISGETVYGTTLIMDGTDANGLRLNSNSSQARSLTIGQINIESAGGKTTPILAQTQASGHAKLTLTSSAKVTAADVAGQSVYPIRLAGSSGNVDLNILAGSKITANVTAGTLRGGIYAIQLGADSNINIESLELDLVGTFLSTTGGVNLQWTEEDTTGSCSVSGVTGLVQATDATASNVFGVRVRGGPDNTTISGCNDLTVRALTARGASAFSIMNSEAWSTDNPVIENNTGVVVDSDDGFLATMGEDGLGDQNVINGIIRNNEMSGNGNTAHGICHFGTPSGLRENNTVSGVNLGSLSKLCTGSVTSQDNEYRDIKPSSATARYLYSKGSVSPIFQREQCYITNSFGGEVESCLDNTGLPITTGAVYLDNQVLQDGGDLEATSKLFILGSGSDASTGDTTNLGIDSNLTLPTVVASVSGTTYATIDDANGDPNITNMYLLSTGSPTLTTPYSIGTNNGPLFTIKTSDTLATIEGAGFFNDNAAYASLLKTGDVVLIEASNGTKLYNVTVDKTSRIITLSTGTAIA